MRLTRIIIGVDLTAPSIRAARWVAQSFAPDAEIVLLHCLNPLLVLKRVAEARAAANRALRELEHAIGIGRSAHCIRVGDAARTLADLAADLDADLVAVGAHEEHPDRLPTLGSTAERLVRCSPVPVLLCATTPTGTPRSVLLPVDAIEVSATLAEWTGALAEQFDARLALVHVEPAAKHEQQTSQGPTTPWSRVARQLGAQRVFVDAVLGDTADAVLAESRRFKSDLVLMQAPDETLGDTTDAVARVMRRSSCPVLVIPSCNEVANV